MKFIRKFFGWTLTYKTLAFIEGVYTYIKDYYYISDTLYSDEFKNLDNIGIRIGAQCSGNVSIQNISIDAVPAEKIYTYWGEDTDGNSIYINNFQHLHILL